MGEWAVPFALLLAAGLGLLGYALYRNFRHVEPVLRGDVEPDPDSEVGR